MHSALLRLGRPVNTCGQDDGQDADDLDEGDGGYLAHGDVERGELAQGEEAGEARIIPGQSWFATPYIYCLQFCFATCLADPAERASDRRRTERRGGLLCP